MIIWGWGGRESHGGQGTFRCPQCQSTRDFQLRIVRNFFRLYFIPIIPLNEMGRYIRCEGCAGTFAEEVLQYNPEQERAEAGAQLIRLMILAALADGSLDSAEGDVIRAEAIKIRGTPIGDHELQEQVRQAIEAQATLPGYASAIADQLTDQGKAVAVRLVFEVMASGGELRPGHEKQLAELPQALGIPENRFREMIEQFSQPDDPADELFGNP